jgi:hypothetical protein
MKDKCSTAVVILTIKEGCRVCAELLREKKVVIGFSLKREKITTAGIQLQYLPW